MPFALTLFSAASLVIALGLTFVVDSAGLRTALRVGLIGGMLGCAAVLLLMLMLEAA